MSESRDEHSGRGGTYIKDTTGKRVLVARTGIAAPVKQGRPSNPAKSKITQPNKVKGASNA